MNRKLNFYQIATLTIFLIFIYALFNKIVPEYKSALDIYGQYEETRKKYEKIRNWKEESVYLKKQINRLRLMINNVNLLLPEKGQVSIPLNIIDSLVTANKIKLSEIQKISADSTKQYQIIRARLKISGEFFNIKNFIKQLENARIVININAFKISLPSLFGKRLNSDIIIEVPFRQKNHN